MYPSTPCYVHSMLSTVHPGYLLRIMFTTPFVLYPWGIYTNIPCYGHQTQGLLSPGVITPLPCVFYTARSILYSWSIYPISSYYEYCTPRVFTPPLHVMFTQPEYCTPICSILSTILRGHLTPCYVHSTLNTLPLMYIRPSSDDVNTAPWGNHPITLYFVHSTLSTLPLGYLPHLPYYEHCTPGEITPLLYVIFTAP